MKVRCPPSHDNVRSCRHADETPPRAYSPRMDLHLLLLARRAGSVGEDILRDEQRGRGGWQKSRLDVGSARRVVLPCGNYASA